jgi:hypothetical protein
MAQPLLASPVFQGGRSELLGLYWPQHRHLNLESWLPDATEDDIPFVSEALLGLA